MTDQELGEFKEFIDSQMAELRRAISEYPKTGYNDKSAAYSEIRSHCDQISNALNEMESTSATWPSLLKAQVNDYTAGVRSEFANMQYRFNDQVAQENRAKLLGDSYTQTIQQEELADAMLDEVNETRNIGIGILEEMGRQRGTIGSISGNLSKMDNELDTGSALLNEMECRSRQRTFFLYGVVVFLLITIGVFIYYILR